MPKPNKTEDKKRKEVEEEEVSSEEESESSDSSENESSDNESNSDSSDSSNSDSSDSDSDDDSSSEEEAKPQKKGKEATVAQGTKHKRDEEVKQPEKKKLKQEVNGNSNGAHAKSAETTSTTTTPKGKPDKDTEKWRTDNHLTVVNIEDGAVDNTVPFVEFSDASFPDFISTSVQNFQFKKPTPIQSQSWPLILQQRDIVGIAETGSGKTLAFGYPAIMAIKNAKKPATGPKALMLAPTRELAQQIHEVIAKACVPANLQACCVFGGVDKREQSAAIRKADIVIGTPGRLIDLIEDGSANLTKVTYLVFDEADRMLDMGFIPQIRQIVKPIPKERQTLMFSATWPVDVQKFAHTYLRSPVQITIGYAGEKLAGAKKVSQLVEVCPRDSMRRSAIKNLLKRLCAKETRPRILLFMLYKNTCDALYEDLVRDKYNVEILHGGKNQNLREKAVARFKEGSAHILVATDVAARGLDIKDIKYVINGEMPLVMEDYIHRIGRTGRAGESGTAYTIIAPDGTQDKTHARQLVRILEEGSHPVPPELAKIAETAPVTKPRKSTMELMYGDFAKNVDAEQMMKKPTKITFD